MIGQTIRHTALSPSEGASVTKRTRPCLAYLVFGGLLRYPARGCQAFAKHELSAAEPEFGLVHEMLDQKHTPAMRSKNILGGGRVWD